MLRVLIVDDLADAAESVATLLKAWGHEPRVCLGGEEAVREAASFKPNLLVVDIAMPGIGGFEVTRRVRALPGLRDLPVIATTGCEGDGVRYRAAKAGIEHYLVKPWDPDTLYALVSAHDSVASVLAP